MIVEIQTDNPKRCLPDIKKIMGRAQILAGKEGSAAWLFDKRGKTSEQQAFFGCALCLFFLLESLIFIIVPNPLQCYLRVQAFRFLSLFLFILL